MEKTNNFWSKLEHNRKYQIVFFIISMCVILGVYIGLRLNMQTRKAEEYTVGVHNDLINYIESAEVTNKNLMVSGWCFYTGVDSSRNQVQVFLRNTEDEEDVIWLDTEPVVRDDVDAYYDCDVDYSQTGFTATGKIKKLVLDTKNYEVMLKLTYVVDRVTKNGEEEILKEKKYVKTIPTGKFLCKGQLTTCLPEEKPMITEAEFLNEIFEQGQMLLYQKDADMYVYQYGAKLYWIAGEDFCFEEDGATKIQYQLDTTRIDRLPAKRQKNGNDWDNKSFDFEKNEIKEETTLPYRVAVCNLPTEYPITHFWTGYYTNSAWVWKEYRTPDIFALYE